MFVNLIFYIFFMCGKNRFILLWRCIFEDFGLELFKSLFLFLVLYKKIFIMFLGNLEYMNNVEEE